MTALGSPGAGRVLRAAETRRCYGASGLYATWRIGELYLVCDSAGVWAVCGREVGRATARLFLRSLLADQLVADAYAAGHAAGWADGAVAGAEGEREQERVRLEPVLDCLLGSWSAALEELSAERDLDRNSRDGGGVIGYWYDEGEREP